MFVLTDKELHKLKRQELLEMLVYLSAELEKLKEENQSLRKRLEEKESRTDETYRLVKASSARIESICRSLGVSCEAVSLEEEEGEQK